jgi:hypothetical protein
MANRAALAILVPVAAISGFSDSPCNAQSYDGTWRGEISCAKLSFAKGPQRVAMTMTVSGNAASYSHPLYNRDNTAQIGTEEGSGTVSATGAVRLSARWAGANPKYSFTASYGGTMRLSTAKLSGTQLWLVEGKPESRSCSIALSR